MRLVAIGFAYTGENGARGAREMEHVAIEGMERLGKAT